MVPPEQAEAREKMIRAQSRSLFDVEGHEFMQAESIKIARYTDHAHRTETMTEITPK